jgi:alcohol dehydrogenase, propanol-preferring
MRALSLTKPAPIEHHPLALVDLPIHQPGPGELLVKIGACGVCRSNLHMIECDWVANGVPAKSPIIPGHEVCGSVAEVGAGVTSFTLGQRVGIQPLWSTCGRCEYCLTGRDQYCQSKHITGETVDGGYAEYMLAKAEHAYAVPNELSDADAAPLFCPGITAYGAVACADLAPGKSVAVFGMGGVGHMVVQFARLTGADVTVVARGRKHLALAEELGAVRTIDATAADPVAELKRAGGVDSAIMFAPSTAVMQQALAATKPAGTVVVGAHAEVGPFAFFEGKKIVGSLLGNRQQMREVLALAAAGKVKTYAETFPLEQGEEALARLKAGTIEARAVLVM